ncbi:MAG: hypothetical protein KVP17_003007 [Porospora cf. gigantea B]|uniref:uncharacterized protein n=1 Tax=Porospora cf. gigantea B TaxID=2853592 RepID=UPI003571C010|nr:MAG: hypothetical protein KVP17_003007 [Porospora cf. gigantea B]
MRLLSLTLIVPSLCAFDFGTLETVCPDLQAAYDIMCTSGSAQNDNPTPIPTLKPVPTASTDVQVPDDCQAVIQAASILFSLNGDCKLCKANGSTPTYLSPADILCQ